VVKTITAAHLTTAKTKPLKNGRDIKTKGTLETFFVWWKKVFFGH